MCRCDRNSRHDSSKYSKGRCDSTGRCDTGSVAAANAAGADARLSNKCSRIRCESNKYSRSRCDSNNCSRNKRWSRCDSIKCSTSTCDSRCDRRSRCDSKNYSRSRIIDA